jgi:hypothetical protein
MALIQCTECGQKYRTDAKQCVACGAKRKTTSPLVVIFGLFVGIGGLSAYFKAQDPPPVPAIPARRNAYAGLAPAEAVKQALALQQAWARTESAKDKNGEGAPPPDDLTDARAALAAIPDADPMKPKATQLIGALDTLKTNHDAAALLRARKNFALAIEHSMLADGMNATVTAEGAGAKTLHITYVMVNKSYVYRATHTDMPAAAAQVGFEHFIFDDGYGHRFAWSPAK